MPTKVNFSDPFLNQFVFDCLFRADGTQKGKLSSKQRAVYRSPATMKHFASKASIDEKISILSKMGIPFFFGFGLDGSGTLKEMYAEYKEKGLLSTVNQTIARKIFLVTEREVALYLGLMANGVHSDTYVMNREYLLMDNYIEEWKDACEKPVDENIHEAMLGARGMARVMLHSIMMSRYSDEYEMDEVGMLILLYIFSKKSYDVPDSDLRHILHPLYKPLRMTSAIKKVLALKLIAHSYRDKKKRYTITALGIELVMRIQKRVLNLTTSF